MLALGGERGQRGPPLPLDENANRAVRELQQLEDGRDDAEIVKRIAIGVVLVGQLFGFVGLFVAVPILSMVVILVDELWVKPLEAKKGVVAASELATPEGSPGPAAAP